MLSKRDSYDLQGLLVGVNYYHDSSIRRLHFAVNDAQELHQALIASSYGFRSRQLDLLLSVDVNTNDALRRNILKNLLTLAQKASEESLLLFYFSGHGDLVNGEPYLCPSDTEKDYVRDTAVPLTRVREIVEASQAPVKVLIFDACHLGARLGTKALVENKAFEEKAKSLFQGVRGLAMLASSPLEETSIETDDKKHGIFTYFLLEALKKQLFIDENHDSQISVGEIFEYVASKLRVHGQQPTIVLEGNGDIPLLRFPPTSLYHPVRSVFPSPVKTPQEFFGRVEELRRARDQLLNTSDVLVFVHGERCIGKTSFINRVKSMLDEVSTPEMRFLHFSIEPSAISSVEDFAREIWNGLKSVCQAVSPTAFGEKSFSFQGYGQFAFDLESVLRPLTTSRFVVFIDEIHKIKSLTDNVTFSQIVGLLRFLIEQTNLPIAFVVSSLEDQAKFFPQSSGSPPPTLDIELAPLERGECDEMLNSLLLLDGEPMSIFFESIYRWSGGHPYVAKMLAAEIYDAVSQQHVQGDKLLLQPAWQEFIVKTASIADANTLFSTLYANFSDDERYVLLSLALRADYSISGKEVAGWRAHHRSAASQLEKTKHYLLRAPDGGYRLRLQLFGEWLKNWHSFPLEEERLGLTAPRSQTIPKEGICVDERDGKVYLNGKEIETKLSNLQYQTLLYLARNAGRVVSRQELYAFLHDEDEAYLPTDQSLDALVYRLRLALGDKEQRYLQTLRKRGYLLKQAILIAK